MLALLYLKCVIKRYILVCSGFRPNLFRLGIFLRVRCSIGSPIFAPTLMLVINMGCNDRIRTASPRTSAHARRWSSDRNDYSGDEANYLKQLRSAGHPHRHITVRVSRPAPCNSGLWGATCSVADQQAALVVLLPDLNWSRYWPVRLLAGLVFHAPAPLEMFAKWVYKNMKLYKQDIFNLI